MVEPPRAHGWGQGSHIADSDEPPEKGLGRGSTRIDREGFSIDRAGRPDAPSSASAPTSNPYEIRDCQRTYDSVRDRYPK